MHLTDALKIRPHRLWGVGNDYIRAHEVTVILCISRMVYLPRFFAAFDKLRLPKEKCHLLMFLNCENTIIENELRTRMLAYSKAFASVEVWKAKRLGGGEPIGRTKYVFDKSKLPVIYAMHRDICDILRTDRFVVFEDDTVMPPDSIVRLLYVLKTHKNCGIATGIETSRAIFRHQKVRLGVHYITRTKNRIVSRLSLPPSVHGIAKVDACGWYCAASYRSVWKKALVDMLKYVRDVPRFGLDMVHTHNVHMYGYDILADFSLWCRHLQASGGKIVEWGREHAVCQIDLWIPFYEVYAEGLEIQWQKKFIPKKN